jgi:catechol 2,3-dioxygenase-like lactoylglutathione lyase family enzyme/predicted enzyme related to lactoylglutathione lyase
MRLLPCVAVLGLALFPTLSQAAEAADYGHLHLTVTDKAAAAQWYAKHFDGEAAGFGGATGPDVQIDRTMIGSIPIVFFQKDAGFEGSVGSTVDHIGFSMEDVAGVLKATAADGGKALSEIINFGGMDIAFVEDPWGTKIELINDPDTRGLHHIHLHAKDADATLNWYQKVFGGEIAKFKGVLPSLKYSGIWLIVQKSDKELAPTNGRAVDHLGWNFRDLAMAAKEMREKGVNFTLDPRPYRNIKIAFVESPDGTRIELVEPPKE